MPCVSNIFEHWQRCHIVTSMTGETLGDLASAAEYATDAAIAKLVKDPSQLGAGQKPGSFNWRTSVT